MITLTKLPAEHQKVLQIQNWLKHKECSDLKSLLLGDVASLQEKASRVLIQASEDERKMADAREAASEAEDIVKFVAMLDRMLSGEYEFQRVKIGVSEKIIWK